MSSHDNGLTSPTTSEVVPSFEKRNNKRMENNNTRLSFWEVQAKLFMNP